MSSISPRAAVQEFVMQYRRTPWVEGYSPSELLNGCQIRTSIDILLPPHTGTSQESRPGKAQSLRLKRSQTELHLLWSKACEGCQMGACCRQKGVWHLECNVRVFPQSGTWRRHVGQLHPH